MTALFRCHRFRFLLFLLLLLLPVLLYALEKFSNKRMGIGLVIKESCASFLERVLCIFLLAVPNLVRNSLPQSWCFLRCMRNFLSLAAYFVIRFACQQRRSEENDDDGDEDENFRLAIHAEHMDGSACVSWPGSLPQEGAPCSLLAGKLLQQT